MTSPLLLASNVFLAWQIGVNYHRFSSGCDLHKISKPPHAIEIHLTDLWLLGDKCEPIIIHDAGGAFHFVFSRTLARRLSGELARLRCSLLT